MPRWSGAMTSKSRASAGISRRQAYQFSGQPCTSSSGGPSPPMTACWRSPPAFTYRLVNVSVNPSGRFGAPETEPGPSGVDSGAEDELMSISFHNLRAFGLGDAARPARLAGRPRLLARPVDARQRREVHEHHDPTDQRGRVARSRATRSRRRTRADAHVRTGLSLAQ